MVSGRHATTVRERQSCRGSVAIAASEAQAGARSAAGERDAVADVKRRYASCAATASPAATRGSASSRDGACRGTHEANRIATTPSERRQLRVGAEAVARAVPRAGGHRHGVRLQHRGRRYRDPCHRRRVIRGDIHLAHPRVEAREHPRRCRESATPPARAPRAWRRHHRQAAAQRESLRDAAGDAHAGERARDPRRRRSRRDRDRRSPPIASTASTSGRTRSELALPARSSRALTRCAVAGRDRQPVGGTFRARGLSSPQILPGERAARSSAASSVESGP